MTIELRVLGPLELVRDGVAVAVGGPRERALLALLVLRGNTLLARNRLIDELWPDEPPESAVNILQSYVSRLRRVLPADRLRTRTLGYELELARGEVDLHRFEDIADDARRSLAAGDAARASERLRQALGLWRGPALADVRETGLVTAEAARLEELRLAALEDRIESDLALGRHAQLVSELELLVAEEPLRERLRAQLMLALYRSGRQSEALAAYREGRARLADELGLEPSSTLRELELAILRQDDSLASPLAPRESGGGRRSLVVACLDDSRFDDLVALAEPLAGRPLHELVLVRIVPDASSLPSASELANERRSRLVSSGVSARAAAFTSGDPAADVVRLATEANAALVLVDAPGSPPDNGAIDELLASLLEPGPCDVAIVAGGGAVRRGEAAPVLVPFGGDEHDWVAAEIGAWIGQAGRRPLQLAGAAADGEGKRDASRLLASVALLVQQVADVQAAPTLVPTGADAILELAAQAHVLLVGVPVDWRERGLGATRERLVREADCPVLLVRGGLRPGGISPAGNVTRFTWTMTSGAG